MKRAIVKRAIVKRAIVTGHCLFTSVSSRKNDINDQKNKKKTVES